MDRTAPRPRDPDSDAFDEELHTELSQIATPVQQGREYTMRRSRDCSVSLLEQEQLGGYPVDQVPLAVHVPMTPVETSARMGLCRCAMLATR